MDAAKKNSRVRRWDQDTIEKTARRALHMVHLGEVSAGRQALEGAAFARGVTRVGARHQALQA